MILAISVCGLVVAVVAGARSTWSPCGLSMLSSITPLSERGRGHRFRTTAAWFVGGGLLGGLTLGGAMAVMAVGIGALHLPVVAVGAIGGCAALVAAASDARLGGFSLPIHRRQVNELWLDGYRTWVYGLGFGWQIGCGLATYVMTAGVYLTILFGALTGRPLVALAIGGVFGLVRGSAVLLGRRVVSTESLIAFHRRFAELGPAALAVVVGCASRNCSGRARRGIAIWLAGGDRSGGGCGAAAVEDVGHPVDYTLISDPCRSILVSQSPRVSPETPEQRMVARLAGSRRCYLAVIRRPSSTIVSSRSPCSSERVALVHIGPISAITSSASTSLRAVPASCARDSTFCRAPLIRSRAATFSCGFFPNASCSSERKTRLPRA